MTKKSLADSHTRISRSKIKTVIIKYFSMKFFVEDIFLLTPSKIILTSEVSKLNSNIQQKIDHKKLQ